MFFVLGCDTPPIVENAEFEVSENLTRFYLNGTTLTYTCESGMRILPEGSNAVTCTESGDWSAGLGQCYSGKRNLFVIFNI